MLESLIKAGALDCFGETRATHIVNYEAIINVSNHDKALSNGGQITLFEDLFGEQESTFNMTKIAEYPKNDILSSEKDMLNLYLSGHPLDEYREKYSEEAFTLNDIKPILDVERVGDDGEENMEDNDVTALIKEYDKKMVSLGGMITDVRIRITKSNKSMAVVKLEDLHSSIDIVFFPTMYDKYKPLLVKDKIVKVDGELQVSGSSQIKSSKLYVNIADNQESTVKNVIEVLSAYPGMIPAILKFKGKALNSGVRIQNTTALLSELAAIVGEDNYKLV